MIHRYRRGMRRSPQTVMLAALSIAPIAGMAALAISATADARTRAARPVRDPTAMVGLGPVRVHQSQILNGAATTDSTGAAAVALTMSPQVGPYILKGLKPLEGRQIPLRVNGERLAAQTVQTSDDGQTVLLRGFMTQEKAATVALHLSGKPPVPTTGQE